MSTIDPPTRPPRWIAAVAASGFALVLLAAALAYRAPAPASASAPPETFSAARARDVLARVLGDEQPHPLGSRANAEVRERIVDELRRLGLEPEVHTAVVGYRTATARVHNVMARIEGRRDGPAVLLAAHYDSVGAGPGAGDDGAAVAAMLETARALLSGPPLEHPVLLLIDDGEELGLFGARAFCQHPWAEDVALVLNFEARGTCGPSLLFESCGPDLASMRRVAGALERPMTGSAFAAVYRTLPNNTDLTVFREHGMTGLNFAFVGGARRYHTPLDDIAHLDLGSLQHHGDNMLSLARAFADAPNLGGSTRIDAHVATSQGVADADADRRPAAAAGEHALFFDVLGRTVLVFPLRHELPACALLLVGWAATCLLQRRRGVLRVRRLAVCGFAVPAALLLAALAGLAARLALVALGRLPTPFPPNPLPHGVCFGLLGVAAALTVVAALRRFDAWHVLAGTGGFFALASTTVAFLLPGSSYPLLVPAAAAWLGVLLCRRSGAALGIAAAVMAVTSALLLAPFFTLLPDVVGMQAGSTHAAVAALGVLCLGPLLPSLLGRRLTDAAIVCSLAALCSIGFAALLPAHDADHPARTNIVHVTLPGTPPCFYLGDADPLPIAARMQRRRPLPWEREGLCVSAAGLDVPPPVVDFDHVAVAKGKFAARGTVRSQRDAPWIVLCLPPGLELERASLGGVSLDVSRTREREGGRRALEATQGWRMLSFLGAEPGEEIEFEVRGRGMSRLKPYVYDRTLGLPAIARPLLRARAAVQAAPIHLGDGVVVAAPVDVP